MRQATDDDFRANISRGGEGIPYEVNEQIEWLSSESAKALDLDIAGVAWTMKGVQNNISKIHKPGATAFGVRLINQFLKGK